MYNKDWHKEMDAHYKNVQKNWWSTGKRKCSTGVTGSISLEDKKSKKTLDNKHSL